MNERTSHRKQSGFTLVELLIVAIILAILAAIVVPQFAKTTTDAEESALRANLSAIRGAIDLYRQQHNGYPGAMAATGGTCTGGTAGTGAIETQQALEDQMGRFTNATGQSCSREVAGSFPFGPYLKEDALPANPVTDSNALVVIPAANPAAGDLEMGADAGIFGWKYDVVSGKFIANDNRNDSAGNPYEEY